MLNRLGAVLFPPRAPPSAGTPSDVPILGATPAGHGAGGPVRELERVAQVRHQLELRDGQLRTYRVFFLGSTHS